MHNSFFKFDNFWVIISAISAIITILGFLGYFVCKSVVKNKIKNSKIKGNYIGGAANQDIKNDKVMNKLTDVEIGGDYIGGTKK